MLFNSWTFLPFLGVVLALYHLLPHRAQNVMLLAASCVFYGAWDWRFLILLTASTSVDYAVGLMLDAAASPARRKLLVAASCAVNLGILGFFKYFNFFIDNARALVAATGADPGPWHLELVLPVGISFYTFHAMSYAVDIYRGKLAPVRNYLDYMLFVLYFPQLVAGPIARAAALIPQVTHPRRTTFDQVVSGLWLTLWGFFKKLVVADNLGRVADGVFNALEPPGGFLCLLGVYAFAFQIYGDFSGYTDIARGLGKLMGFELALNFQLPYAATDPRDFWSRWHISLSTWLRDYLYIPLGGNRGGTAATCRNLLLTMLLGGLWHGAAWNFVLWGAYHGLLLVGHRLLTGERPAAADPPGSGPNPVVALLQRAAMFHAVCLGWLFFRATSLGQIGAMLGRLIGGPWGGPGWHDPLGQLLLFGGMLWALELWLRNADDPRTRPGWNVALGPLTVSFLLAALLFLSAGPGKEFLYFQF
jgi:D-alanyl-lipoteichoic acid acyltransferase DltB (MBOAT superfamily)